MDVKQKLYDKLNNKRINIDEMTWFKMEIGGWIQSIIFKSDTMCNMLYAYCLPSTTEYVLVNKRNNNIIKFTDYLKDVISDGDIIILASKES